MVADTRYKYIWNNGDEDELYDLETDPYEMHNLIHGSGSHKLSEMQTALGDWMNATGDPLTAAYRDQIDV